jgi:hypothetical protein
MMRHIGCLALSWSLTLLLLLLLLLMLLLSSSLNCLSLLSLQSRHRLIRSLMHCLSLRLSGLHLLSLSLLLLWRHRLTILCRTGRLRRWMDELLLLLRRHGPNQGIWLLSRSYARPSCT